MTKVDSYIRISEIIYNSLHDDITQDEQEMLDCWLKDEGHMKFFLSIKNSGRLYEDLLDMQYMAVDEAFERMQGKMVQKKRNRWWKWVSGMAAMLTLGLGIWMWNRTEEQPDFEVVANWQPVSDQTILHTAAGKTVVLADSIDEVDTRQTAARQKPVETDIIHYNILATSSRGSISVMLNDSTRVWLNAGSELRYPELFSDHVREVYLKGEAYFEVTKDTGRPFVVRTTAGQVKVLGTQFNVLAPVRGNWVTTLVKGSVKVITAKDDSVIISPGQQVVADDKGDLAINSVNTRYYTAWKKNLFAFQDETLYYIMEVLSDWYGFPFDIESVELANVRFTTMIEKFPGIDDVLEILQRTDKFTFVRNRDGRIEIRK